MEASGAAPAPPGTRLDNQTGRPGLANPPWMPTAAVALQELEGALALDGDVVLYGVAMIFLCVHIGEYSRALQMCTDLLNRHSAGEVDLAPVGGGERVLELRGRIHLLQGRTAAAAKDIEGALQSLLRRGETGHPVAALQCTLAGVHVCEGTELGLETAARLFEDATFQSEGRLAAAHHGRARVRVSRGLYGDAELDVLAAAKREEMSAVMDEDTLAAYQLDAEVITALLKCHRAAALEARLEGLLGRVTALRPRGMAVAVFREPHLRGYIAACKAKQGRWEDALRDLQSVPVDEVAPQGVVQLVHLKTVALVNLGREPEAAGLLERATEVSPANCGLMLLRALLNVCIGRDAEASRDFARAYTMDGTSGVVAQYTSGALKSLDLFPGVEAACPVALRELSLPLNGQDLTTTPSFRWLNFTYNDTWHPLPPSDLIAPLLDARPPAVVLPWEARPSQGERSGVLRAAAEHAVSDEAAALLGWPKAVSRRAAQDGGGELERALSSTPPPLAAEKKEVQKKLGMERPDPLGPLRHALLEGTAGLDRAAAPTPPGGQVLVEYMEQLGGCPRAGLDHLERAMR
eukprot:CAMPEP_0182881268 /NCGR_PEP_ID=MMETSP0034_2-20130328/17079_1 /TAXON_ID=156128 /ORGANISM="Nephroselmis pyriformis, Strain CCMP717" /LENGTH=577 /DNA_ID=CAMNT_0025014293 /DNA_START=26 /DNA_END=1759 /DNA_ORIENTATION=+